MNDYKYFDDLNIELIDGDRGKNYPRNDEMFEKEYCLFLNAKNVTINGFVFDENVFITKEKDELLRKGKLNRNDIVLTTRGTIGNVGLYDESVKYDNVRINSGMLIIRNNDLNINTKYLYYQLTSPFIRDQIFSLKTGSAQPQIPITVLKKLKLLIPDKNIQDKIVKVMDSVVNKIKLNNEINNNLYEFTNKLFEEKILNNQDKDDWTEYVLSDISKMINGYSYKGNELTDKSDIGMATIKNFERTGGFKLDGFKDLTPEKAKKDHYVKPYEVLVACTDLTQNADIIGNAIMLLNTLDYNEIIMSMDLVKLVPITNFVNNYMLYAIVNSKDFKDFALGYKSGTTVLHLNKNCFKEYTIKLPNEDILKDLSKVIEVNYKKLSQIIAENKKLEQLRDTLLPKLMNGEIDLDNIEI